MKFPYPNHRHIAIVGLDDPHFGRSCERHEICGHSVQLNDLCYLKPAVVKLGSSEKGNLVMRQAVKAVRIEDGSESCIVGFLDRRLLRNKDAYVHKYVQVIKDLRVSDGFELRRSNERRGVVEAILLDAIQDHFSETKGSKTHVEIL